MVKYTYDAWGNHTVTDYTDFGLGSVNPIRYRSYYYDTETGLYFLQTRYYDPQTGRFINIDDISYPEPEIINGLNLYAYCGNNPISRIDPVGCSWSWSGFWKFLGAVAIVVGVTALIVVTAGGFAVALGATSTMISATMVGAVVGGAWGGTHYALQHTGKMAIKTNINKLINNPLDDFVTVGPKDGGISNYVRSISQTGDYGQIFASKLSNGMYQIANGHHRVAALRQLGYKFVNIFLVP